METKSTAQTVTEDDVRKKAMEIILNTDTFMVVSISESTDPRKGLIDCALMASKDQLAEMIEGLLDAQEFVRDPILKAVGAFLSNNNY